MNDCRSFACASKGCQNVIHLHHDTEQKLRRTHETFYCPGGHSNYFPGATSEEKRISSLERQIERWRENWRDAYDEAQDWKYRAKTCPFGCGFRSRRRAPESLEADLVFHMVEEHGATMPVVEEVLVNERSES